jgi:hypothetical protein
MFDVHTTCRDSCFLKLVCFFPWLAGRFHNYELTQNREKTRNGLTLHFFLGLRWHRTISVSGTRLSIMCVEPDYLYLRHWTFIYSAIKLITNRKKNTYQSLLAIFLPLYLKIYVWSKLLFMFICGFGFTFHKLQMIFCSFLK